MSRYPRSAPAIDPRFFANAGGSSTIVSYCAPRFSSSRRKSNASASTPLMFVRRFSAAFSDTRASAAADASTATTVSARAARCNANEPW